LYSRENLTSSSYLTNAATKCDTAARINTESVRRCGRQSQRLMAPDNVDIASGAYQLIKYLSIDRQHILHTCVLRQRRGDMYKTRDDSGYCHSRTRQQPRSKRICHSRSWQRTAV